MKTHPYRTENLSSLRVADRDYSIASLAAMGVRHPESKSLPYSLRVLLENLIRHEDGQTVSAADIERLARWDPRAEPAHEIAFVPARVLMQDFTGVPAIVDLAAMRDAMVRMGGDAALINPLQPSELVIDHSVQVDRFGSPDALAVNTANEYARNRERYTFLRWGQTAFRNLEVVPPETGIVHQVNLEYLARVVFTAGAGSDMVAYPDTVVGTDSHTTMINGLGVLGWGVGGIEAEAAMLGQPISMLVPQVFELELVGQLPAGATATDLVLTVTELLRKRGVVGKFVEFTGSGLAALPLADRATIANMAPEYGATCGFFPVDGETLRFLRLSGRSAEQVALVEAYCRAQGLFYLAEAPRPRYSDRHSLDLASVRPSVAGPRRPQDRVDLARVAAGFGDALPSLRAAGATGKLPVVLEMEGRRHDIGDGAVVIAAITSCTNTSNPSVMIGAGLLAKKAVLRGLTRKPWVKTSLAPGSRVVSRYLAQAGLDHYLEKLGFHTVGFGCTTCIGNSGPLPDEVARTLANNRHLVAAAVLSGNRNFEGRIHADVRANYLMSPPLVVAYAIAGRVDLDLTTEPIASDSSGAPVFLADIWPSAAEIADTLSKSVRPAMFTETYASMLAGDESWRLLPVPAGVTYAWDPASTYILHPPYFDGMPVEPAPVADIRGARVLAWLGDSVTTDHISPAGSIHPKSPAADYLRGRGVAQEDFNSYGARRGNHEVMVRGTFANTRLKNLLAPGTEGGVTRHLPSGEAMTIFAASERYRREAVPLVVIAGKEYGTGSSRDWAGKGPALLGVKIVIAKSFERIHRSNLIGMGVLPLEFLPGEDAGTLGLTGEEVFDLPGLGGSLAAGVKELMLVAHQRGETREIRVRSRIDTPREGSYYAHGGILPYVLRQLLRSRP